MIDLRKAIEDIIWVQTLNSKSTAGQLVSLAQRYRDEGFQELLEETRKIVPQEIFNKALAKVMAGSGAGKGK